MDKASYFEKLVESLSRIASHSYYPGKEDAVEQCLEEIEEIRLSGQITAEQSAALRDLLLGEEPFYMLEGALRERSRCSETAKPTRLPSPAKVTGVMPLSRRASSKGSWNKTVTTARSQPSAACLAGLSAPYSPGMACFEEILREP